MITALIEFILLRIAYPIAIELIRKRDLDPAFKAASDLVFAEIDAAKTTSERRAALRKLDALKKS